jgi:hypothetical protein
MSIPLHPTLTAIERDLFAPDEDAAVATQADVDPLVPGDVAAPPMPARLQELVRRKVAATQANQAPPAVGQIRCLVSVPDGQGQGRALGKTCGVLLERWLGGRCWASSLVAQEADYASDRDLVLQDEDDLVAPEAAMVQAWNPVEVELSGDEVLLGTLSPATLRAVLKLADPGFVYDDFVAPRPGRIGAWDLDPDTTVVTGTPLGEDDDPRVAYQALYRNLAAEITHATLARRVAAGARTGRREAAWWSWLRRAFVRPAFTFGLLAVVVGQTTWMLAGRQPDGVGDGVVYRGMTKESQALACRPRLRIVFKLDTPYAELVLALRRANATLIDGPSQTGEIWVLPPADQDPREAASMLQQHHLVERVDVVPPDSHRCGR